LRPEFVSALMAAVLRGSLGEEAGRRIRGVGGGAAGGPSGPCCRRPLWRCGRQGVGKGWGGVVEGATVGPPPPEARCGGGSSEAYCALRPKSLLAPGRSLPNAHRQLLLWSPRCNALKNG